MKRVPCYRAKTPPSPAPRSRSGSTQRSLSTRRVRVLVLIVAPDPHLGRVTLVASRRRPVEECVEAEHEFEAASGGRVRVVDDPVLEGERAEDQPFRQVPSRVGAALGRQSRNGAKVALQSWRQLLFGV